MIRQNKKGWLRILEAFIAIMLVASILLIVYLKNPGTKSNQVCKLEETLLEEVASDTYLRNAVLAHDNKKIFEFVKARTPDGFNSTIRICNVTDICGLQEYEKDVCARERVISANLTAYQPRKVKIFMWREK